MSLIRALFLPSVITYWISCSLLICIYRGNFVTCNGCVNGILGLYKSSDLTLIVDYVFLREIRNHSPFGHPLWCL